METSKKCRNVELRNFIFPFLVIFCPKVKYRKCQDFRPKTCFQSNFLEISPESGTKLMKTSKKCRKVELRNFFFPVLVIFCPKVKYQKCQDFRPKTCFQLNFLEVSPECGTKSMETTKKCWKVELRNFIFPVLVIFCPKVKYGKCQDFRPKICFQSNFLEIIL